MRADLRALAAMVFLTTTCFFATSASAQDGDDDDVTEERDVLDLLDGALFTQQAPAASYVGTMTLGDRVRQGPATYAVDFVIGRRPYRCTMTLVENSGVLAGQAKACRWMDNGQPNPTVCNLYFDLGATGFVGTSFCSPSGVYRTTIQIQPPR